MLTSIPWGMVMLVAVCLLGGTVAGATGFGFALVTVPVAGLVVAPTHAVALGLVVGGAFSMILAFSDREQFVPSTALWVWPVSLIGMPLGVVVLRTLSADWLSTLIGVVVIFFAVLVFRGARMMPSATGLLTAGFSSGLLATSTGLSGPPVVLACQAIGMSPRQVRATSSGVIGAQAWVAASLAAVMGVYAIEALQVIAVAFVPCAVGWWLGARLVSKAPDELLRTATFVLLILSGLASVISGVM